MFYPGSAPMESVNLSNKKAISFWEKGNGDVYKLAVFSESYSGQNNLPAMTDFEATKEWKYYTFPLSQFQTDGSDFQGMAFVAFQHPGNFEFELDQVEIK